MTDPAYDATDRRPIQSRNTWWAERATQRLVRLGVSPNAISIFGMLAAMAAGFAFCATDNVTGIGQRLLWLAAGLLCQLRLLCNLLDGMVAVKRGMASPKGELFNEVPDRISDAFVFVGLGYSLGGNIAIGYTAALVSVFVAYVRTMAKSIGAPNDFCGPMAKPQRMALATIVALYLAMSPASWRLPWGEPTIAVCIVTVLGLATALRRLSRAASYLERAAT